MGFCHAIETMIQQANERGDASLDEISVTCFERSKKPGGVWKAADASSTTEAMNMYDALWTNGPSHCTEFSDYTFDEHFGRPVTVYMSRAEVLGYIIGRVTKNCPDFMEKYIQFDTKVTKVEFDKDANKFNVSTHSSDTSETQTLYFDKVVWACGDNGEPKVPGSVRALFQGFQGRFIHSSETGNLEEDVRGKRILLIGGGYSVEDLALQAIKLGVEKVYIAARDPEGCGCVAKCWPENKVVVLKGEIPFALENDSRVIKCCETEWTWDDSYKYSEEVSTELHDIDTVIACTGYDLNFNMLSDELTPGSYESEHKLEVPDGWKMPDNAMTKHIGDVETGNVYYYVDLTYPELYRGVLVSNPGMMFVWTYDSDFPLLSADTSAWLLAAYCTGTAELPATEEMIKQNTEQALCELQHPWLRYYMDENYHKTLVKLPGFLSGEYKKVWEEWIIDATLYRMKLLARHMRAGNYPTNIGDFEELNDFGKKLLHFDQLSFEHRSKITPDVIKEHPWKTFRDYNNSKEFYSLQTGTSAVPLSQHWLDIDSQPSLHEEEKKNSW